MTDRPASRKEPFEHITYEYLGIDPVSFYDGRFASDACPTDYFSEAKSNYDIELSRLRFLTDHVQGGTVLDLGCGAGYYGVTLKKHCRVRRLVGVDMDPTSTQKARAVYDAVEVIELRNKLPFEDHSFDAVFSVDFFGHVEFRHKDALIEDIFRVTKPGGLSLHAIESGELDYSKIDVNDPSDVLLKYVRTEGHVGVESAERLRERWGRLFEVVSIENAFIFPFYPISAYPADESFDAGFRSTVANFSAEQRTAAQVCLGFVCDYLKDVVRKISPAALVPVEKAQGSGRLPGRQEKLPHEPDFRRIVTEVFRKSCGLVYLVCRKPAQGSSNAAGGP